MRLKQKEEEEEALRIKASISIPLLDEHSDDVNMARKIPFLAKSSSQDKRKKRLDIKTQSVFSSSSSSGVSKKDGRPTKKAHALLVEACSRSATGRGLFNRPNKVGVVRTKELRNSLGIVTSHATQS